PAIGDLADERGVARGGIASALHPELRARGERDAGDAGCGIGRVEPDRASDDRGLDRAGVGYGATRNALRHRRPEVVLERLARFGRELGLTGERLVAVLLVHLGEELRRGDVAAAT